MEELLGKIEINLFKITLREVEITSMKNDIALITPISKDLLYVKIADAIHSYIKQNNLNPGDRIPSERELSKQFQTGRHSVREALRVLENQGIIEVRMGSGTFVAETRQNTSFYMEFVKVNYQELVCIKTELEKYAAREAMRKASPEQMRETEKCLELLEAGHRRGEFLSDVDAHFHHLLVEMSGNKMLLQIIMKMIETVEDYYRVLPKNEQRCLDTIGNHREIMDGLKEKNIEKVERAYDEMKEINLRLIKYSGQPVGNEKRNCETHTKYVDKNDFIG